VANEIRGVMAAHGVPFNNAQLAAATQGTALNPMLLMGGWNNPNPSSIPAQIAAMEGGGHPRGTSNEFSMKYPPKELQSEHPKSQGNRNFKKNNNESNNKRFNGGKGDHKRSSNDKYEKKGASALSAEDKEKKPSYCWTCGHNGHFSKECPVKRDSYDPTVDYRRICTNCGDHGHYFGDCKKPKKGN